VSRTSKRLLIAIPLLLGVGVASPAVAAPFGIDPNAYTFTNGSTTGQLMLVDWVFGTPTDAGTITFAGPFPGITATDITLIFQLTAVAGSIEDIGVSAVVGFTGRQITGHGTIPGTGEVAVTSGPFTNNLFGGQAGFDFGVPGLDSANAAADESNYFFVSFQNLTADATENVRLMVDPGTGADFSVAGPLVVPEPSTLLLLAAGALGIAGAARRSS
jgi:hypothetical protein